MSAEKGGALVRSPPGLVGGVDSYKARLGKGTNWDHPTPPPLPLSGNQSQQQRNASVTKISSEGKGSFNSKNSRKKKHSDKSILQNGISDEDEWTCGCEASTRVRQLEHDFIQLHKIHGEVLKGLHQQMEELKQKNRDLTFQLLMGPYATSVHVDILQSPESDTATPKEESKKEDKSTSTSETELEITPQQEHVDFLEINQPNDGSAQGVKTVVQRRQRRGRSGDPRQVRSLDIELLEEEADELRKELEKEKDKNNYLLTLTEDLKRQIRDETGSWHPPKLPSTKRAMKPPLKPMPINISSFDSHMQRTDPFLSSQSLPENQLEQNSLGCQNTSGSTNKKYEKKCPILPVIRKQADDISLSLESQLHLVEKLKVEHQGRFGSTLLTNLDGSGGKKTKTKQHLEGNVLKDQIGKSFQPSSYGSTQTRKDQRQRKQPESNRSNEHFIFQSPKQLQRPVKSKKFYQQHPRQTITDQLNLQELPQQIEIKGSQRKRSSSGSMTRVIGSSRTRSISSHASTNTRKQEAESNSINIETKTINSVSVAPSKATSSQYDREQTSASSQPLANGDMKITVITELSQISEPPKQKRTKGSKVEFSSEVNTNESSTHSSHNSSDANLASSSSSVGSLASASGTGRPKNKGRPHRRGRGRNKKETTESKGEGKKQL